MPEPAPFRRPIRWDKLRSDEARDEIRRRVAEDTDNVIIGEHALERKDERSAFTDLDVFDILEHGEIEGAPQRVNRNEWKVIVVKRMPGTREAGVVTLIAIEGNGLFVKTVEWMDWLR